jgi:hypothetical protein
MSSASELTITHVILGEGTDPAIDALLAAGGCQVKQLRLTGKPGDGRALLEAFASSDRLVYDPWPALHRAAEAGTPSVELDA